MSSCSDVLSRDAERLEHEDVTGRFHASLAFRREIFNGIGGWRLTKRGDFDQQLFARLNAIEAPGDPCQFADPSYNFAYVRDLLLQMRSLCCSHDVDVPDFRDVSGMTAAEFRSLGMTLANQ
ncbi:MAG: hypothetical protein ACKON9_24140, partial [Planctomycetaceae bacterium]